MASQDQEGGPDLLGPLHDHLERLADEDLRLDLHVRILLGHHLGPLDVGLRQLEEALIDDVVVELLLLLELEDASGLDREDVLDVVEHGVVELDIE